MTTIDATKLATVAGGLGALSGLPKLGEIATRKLPSAQNLPSLGDVVFKRPPDWYPTNATK